MVAPLLCYFARCSKAPQPTFFSLSYLYRHSHLHPRPALPLTPFSFAFLSLQIPAHAMLTFGPSLSLLYLSLLFSSLFFSSTSIATISSSCSSLATPVWARVVCSFDSQTTLTPRAISRPSVLTLYVLFSAIYHYCYFVCDWTKKQQEKKETTFRKNEKPSIVLAQEQHSFLQHRTKSPLRKGGKVKSNFCDSTGHLTLLDT